MLVENGVLRFLKLLNVALLLLVGSSGLYLPHLCIALLYVQLPLTLVHFPLQFIHFVVYVQVKVDVMWLSRKP